ncbi:AcrR family transcriptional regulator [Psychromicrobium silvestre]|uniref:AcrR family transcriptional regulator n=1 Tax=Psychromicrobium silvestre TaxID=1645614 RepID=A0A7Y9LT59_9MICC|nr:TetR/AcrR family transcriptional regulator [Psychromicrobium silvestre]NYE95129.1 AcrR family transcriptional regulator [Psychromicrobium silvestre]
MPESSLLARPTNLRADSARNRTQILETARQMLLDDGALLSMNALAHAAGVGVGTVYRHFPTIQVLLESLAADSFAKLVTEAQAASNEPDGSLAFERIIRAGFDGQLEDPGLAAILAAPSFECADMHDFALELFGSIGTIIVRARQAGALRPDITPDDIRRLLNGMHLATKDLPTTKREQYLDVLLRGLRTTRSDQN